jgi:exonuclease 3'-5' domain-containing protein 1
MAFEKAHDISLDEPCVAHQAILFMLDILMRSSKTSLTLEELYDSFGDKSFTPQMLRAVGGNEQGLKTFVLKYPSLFTINNDLISANSGGTSGQLARLNSSNERYLRKSKSSKNSCIANPNNDVVSLEDPATDLDISDGFVPVNLSCVTENQSGENPVFSKTMKEIEQEAIAFFRKQISKREEDWLPIVSVAGHASQSSSDIRKFVGPQNEFKSFLLKYPHIFLVRDEYCGLKGRADCSNQPFPPPSPPPRRRIAPLIGTGANNVLIRNHSFKSSLTNRYSACANLMPNTPINSNVLLNSVNTSSFSNNYNTNSVINGVNNNNLDTSHVLTPSILNSVSNASISIINNSKARLTSLEVKAVHYVMRILHKNGRMLLQTIPGLISRAPDHVSSIVGFTREDLIQFFKRHSAIFQLHPDGCVSVKQDAVKALILKDNSNASISTTPNNISINQAQESEG